MEKVRRGGVEDASGGRGGPPPGPLNGTAWPRRRKEPMRTRQGGKTMRRGSAGGCAAWLVAISAGDTPRQARGARRPKLQPTGSPVKTSPKMCVFHTPRLKNAARPLASWGLDFRAGPEAASASGPALKSRPHPPALPPPSPPPPAHPVRGSGGGDPPGGSRATPWQGPGQRPGRVRDSVPAGAGQRPAGA